MKRILVLLGVTVMAVLWFTPAGLAQSGGATVPPVDYGQGGVEGYPGAPAVDPNFQQGPVGPAQPYNSASPTATASSAGTSSSTATASPAATGSSDAEEIAEEHERRKEAIENLDTGASSDPETDSAEATVKSPEKSSDGTPAVTPIGVAAIVALGASAFAARRFLH